MVKLIVILLVLLVPLESKAQGIQYKANKFDESYAGAVLPFVLMTSADILTTLYGHSTLDKWPERNRIGRRLLAEGRTQFFFVSTLYISSVVFLGKPLFDKAPKLARVLFMAWGLMHYKSAIINVFFITGKK